MSMNELPNELLAKIAKNSDACGALDLEAAVNQPVFTEAERQALKARVEDVEEEMDCFFEAAIELCEAVGWSARGVEQTPAWAVEFRDSASTLRWLASKQWETDG